MAELKAAIRIRAENRSSATLESVARGSEKVEGHLAAVRKELADLHRKDSAIRKFPVTTYDVRQLESLAWPRD